MSDKRATMRERAQRFRRRMNGKDRAVSPVVATLILILIAVAAAAALYLWLVVWQGHITSGIGNVGAQPTLYIGGSTSVYPFDELAVTWFEQNNSDITISNEQGGSGAGMDAVCSGAVGIGAASFPVDAATLVADYGCSSSVESTIVVTTVAYDAVDLIVPSANPHGLLSVSYDTLALIYADDTIVAGGTPKLISTTATTSTITENGQTLAAVDAHAAGAIPIPSTVAKATESTWLEWDQIPAAVEGATVGTFTQQVAVAADETPTVGCGATSGAALYDTCYGTGVGTTPSTCGFTVCAGGQTSGSDQGVAPISTVARSDASGTTQSFEARLLDAESSTTFATSAQLQAPTTGFSGCGSNNYISDCGFVANQTASGNPGVISAVADSNNAIGYASDGLVRAAGSGVTYLGFLGVGQTVAGAAAGGVSGGTSFGGIVPTTGSAGTIAYGINAAKDSSYGYGYLGWRPFDLVTLSTPTGVAAEFLTFITNPGINPSLATDAQEVGIYSV